MTFIICVFCTFKNKLTSRNCFICENSLEEKEEENKNEVNENNNNNKKNDNERVEDIIEIIEDEDIEIIEIIEEVKNDKRKRGNTLEKEKRNNNNNNINNNNNNQEEDEEEMIECPNCTFKNNKINKECELCSSLLKKRRVVSMNEDNDFEGNFIFNFLFQEIIKFSRKKSYNRKYTNFCFSYTWITSFNSKCS